MSLRLYTTSERCVKFGGKFTMLCEFAAANHVVGIKHQGVNEYRAYKWKSLDFVDYIDASCYSFICHLVYHFI